MIFRDLLTHSASNQWVLEVKHAATSGHHREEHLAVFNLMEPTTLLYSCVDNVIHDGIAIKEWWFD